MRLRKVVGAALAAMVACSAPRVACALEPEKPPAELSMDTMVVTPEREERPIGETAPSITVISGEELAKKQSVNVFDALREVPGVEVFDNGSRGSVTSVFLRGSATDQVLVLVDGVRVNSTTLGSFDFANLTTENVDRVEVLRGFGGTLYGSEAIGGVIQVFTKKGEGPPHGGVSLSGGNGQTDREVGEISGQSGIFSYSASASHLHTGGFKPENDDYENVSISGRLDAQVLDDGAAKLVFRLGDSEFGNFFNNNFLAVPDPNARQKDQSDTVRAEWGQAPLESLRYNLAFGFARADQQFRDPPDAGESSLTDSDILSETYDGEAQSTLGWWEKKGETTVGIDYEVQRGDIDSLFSDPVFGDFPTNFDRDTRTVAGFAMNHLALDDRRLVLLAGVRVDDNSRFGRAVSPSGGLSYAVEATGTRLRTTYGEGFKAPTLNQLFFPGFGNPDLGPETSWEVDGGFDQPLFAGQALVSTTYFHRVVSDLIEGVPQPNGLLLAENVGDATTDGIEAALELVVAQGLRAGGSYTYLEIDANASGRVRRPRHSGSVHIDADCDDLYRKGDHASVRARLLLVGDRLDFDPVAGFAVRDNPAYQRADLAVAYDWPLAVPVVQKVGVFARVENLFDRDYDEVIGFGARPLNVLAGVRGGF